jgi:hypothetical protein
MLDTDNLSGDVSSMKYITLVDTPGQSIFYRMRNYGDSQSQVDNFRYHMKLCQRGLYIIFAYSGASVAEFAVLVVAADDGVCIFRFLDKMFVALIVYYIRSLDWSPNRGKHRPR